MHEAPIERLERARTEHMLRTMRAMENLFRGHFIQDHSDECERADHDYKLAREGRYER